MDSLSKGSLSYYHFKEDYFIVNFLLHCDLYWRTYSVTWFSSACTSSCWGQGIKDLSLYLSQMVGINGVIHKAISSKVFHVYVCHHWQSYSHAFFLLICQTQLEACCLYTECQHSIRILISSLWEGWYSSFF